MGFCDFFFFLSRPKAWMSSVNGSQFESVMFPMVNIFLPVTAFLSLRLPVGVGWYFRGQEEVFVVVFLFLFNFSKGS